MVSVAVGSSTQRYIWPLLGRSSVPVLPAPRVIVKSLYPDNCNRPVNSDRVKLPVSPRSTCLPLPGERTQRELTVLAKVQVG